MTLIQKIKMQIKIDYLNKIWRKNNKHNFSNVISIFPLEKVIVGDMTYCDLNIRSWNNHDSKLVIGNYCSIAEGTMFFLSGEHDYKRFSSYPFDTRIFGEKEIGRVSKGNIIIGDDVWIGANCIILSGVKIGQGAVVGAGSIVSKNIPPYAIFANGRIIKYRFNEDMIERMLEFDFSKLTQEDIRNNRELAHRNLDYDFFETAFFNKHKRN